MGMNGTDEARAAITLTVPRSVVNDLVYLAELSGDTPSDEARKAVTDFLAAHTRDGELLDVGDWLDQLFAAIYTPEPTERLRLSLPLWQLDWMRELAETDHATMGNVFTAVLAPVLRGRSPASRLQAPPAIADVEIVKLDGGALRATRSA